VPVICVGHRTESENRVRLPALRHRFGKRPYRWREDLRGLAGAFKRNDMNPQLQFLLTEFFQLTLAVTVQRARVYAGTASAHQQKTTG